MTPRTPRTPGGVLGRVLRCNGPVPAPVPVPPQPPPPPTAPVGLWDAAAADAALAAVRRGIDDALRSRWLTPPQRSVLGVFLAVEERHLAAHDPLLFTAVEDLEKLLASWRRGPDTGRPSTGA